MVEHARSALSGASVSERSRSVLGATATRRHAVETDRFHASAAHLHVYQN
jgi:hypothetical protein